MYHPAAEKLDPTAAPAHVAPDPFADGTRGIELGRGFREREVGRPKPGADVRAEDRAHESLEGSLQIGERDPSVNGESLHLMEHWRVSRVERIATVRLTGCDHVYRRRLCLHRADLNGRRVSAEKRRPVRDGERVLKRSRRYVGRHVERIEVVHVGLDLWSLRDVILHPNE